MKKDEARTAWNACGLSETDPFILALKDPKKWAGAIGTIAAGYAVLLIVRWVVCL